MGSIDVIDKFQQDLAGKNALITGATRGIGRAIAFNLARRGANIIGTSSSEATLHLFRSLEADIADSYCHHQASIPRFIGIPANILSLETPERLADSVQDHFNGELNILVNNACYDEMRPMGSLDDDFVQKVLLGNCHHPVMLMDVLYRRGYIKPYSRIINLSSVSGRQIPFPSMYFVGASKAVLEALTRTWATLLADDAATKGTTVNALLVGATATPGLIREAPDVLKERAREVLRSGVPILGETGIGRPEDVADVAGLLVGENARWVTGGVVSANGGAFPRVM
ncbi:hypothetical protein V3481_007410 [Fusarium oxysporum f. sp. vasinfectum]|nr:hypothetical protein FOTG_19020 [Fusarium oxysporum f. sp. vasinfectum 25433]